MVASTENVIHDGSSGQAWRSRMSADPSDMPGSGQTSASRTRRAVSLSASASSSAEYKMTEVPMLRTVGAAANIRVTRRFDRAIRAEQAQAAAVGIVLGSPQGVGRRSF